MLPHGLAERAVFQEPNDRVGNPAGIIRHKDFFILFLIGCGSLTLFSVVLGIHSGYVTFLTFFLLSVYIWIQRPDLIRLSIFSAFATLAISLAIYYLNFNLLFPHFWDKYGMLDKPVLGYKLLNIPLSEMLLHFTWAMLCSMFRGYRNGVYYKTENFKRLDF